MIKRAWKIGYVEVVEKIEKLNSQICEFKARKLRLGGGSFAEQREQSSQQTDVVVQQG